MLYPRTRRYLVDAAVTIDYTSAGLIEAITPPRTPLDLLAVYHGVARWRLESPRCDEAAQRARALPRFLPASPPHMDRRKKVRKPNTTDALPFGFIEWPSRLKQYQ